MNVTFQKLKSYFSPSQSPLQAENSVEEHVLTNQATPLNSVLIAANKAVGMF